MKKKVEINILHAFVNKEGKFGNPTGIVVDTEHNFSPHDRQTIATKLHFTDTVFINSLDTVNVSFYNPQQETRFAGDALLSTSYFLNHVLQINKNEIICRAGSVTTWTENELAWLEASIEGTAGWIHQQLPSPTDIDAITPEEAAKFEHTMVWAWADEKRGLIRSRTFLPDWGTLEVKVMDQGQCSL